MTEVSSWNETDNANNLTPPDGWPEGMQPSAVNDCGRMMMGAVKRWYNTVTAAVAACMPISGGTFTGAIVAPQITSNGNINAAGDIGCRTLYTSANVQASGDVHGGSFYAGGTVQGAYLNSTGNIHAAGEIRADGTLVGNSVWSGSDIFMNSGTLTADNVTARNNVSVNGRMTANYATVNGTLDVGGALTAASASISGAIGCNTLTASAAVNTTTYQIGGANFAARGSDAAGLYNAVFDGPGGVALVFYGPNGSYYRCDNAHVFSNRAATYNVCRFQTGDGNCINASGYWNIVSDISTKEAIEPYRAGLAELLALNPVSYRYIPGENPFAIEGQRYYGLVAQDVERIVPEMVGRTDDGLATVAPGHLVFVLLNAVKELEARLAQVENRGG